jgi:hypothetical protein
LYRSLNVTLALHRPFPDCLAENSFRRRAER